MTQTEPETHQKNACRKLTLNLKSVTCSLLSDLNKVVTKVIQPAEIVFDFFLLYTKYTRHVYLSAVYAQLRHNRLCLFYH